MPKNLWESITASLSRFNFLIRGDHPLHKLSSWPERLLFCRENYSVEKELLFCRENMLSQISFLLFIRVEECLFSSVESKQTRHLKIHPVEIHPFTVWSVLTISLFWVTECFPHCLLSFLLLHIVTYSNQYSIVTTHNVQYILLALNLSQEYSELLNPIDRMQFK